MSGDAARAPRRGLGLRGAARPGTPGGTRRLHDLHDQRGVRRVYDVFDSLPLDSTGSITNVTVTICGRIPPGADVSARSSSDSITATIPF
jgi:hypothetical protein